jgi:hypothetical protein
MYQWVDDDPLARPSTGFFDEAPRLSPSVFSLLLTLMRCQASLLNSFVGHV